MFNLLSSIQREAFPSPMFPMSLVESVGYAVASLHAKKQPNK